MSFTSPVRSKLLFKYSLLSRIMMSSYKKLAKQRMLLSISYAQMAQLNYSKNFNGVCKIKHCDLETTGYEHALLRS